MYIYIILEFIYYCVGAMDGNNGGSIFPSSISWDLDSIHQLGS